MRGQRFVRRWRRQKDAITPDCFSRPIKTEQHIKRRLGQSYLSNSICMRDLPLHFSACVYSSPAVFCVNQRRASVDQQQQQQTRFIRALYFCMNMKASAALQMHGVVHPEKPCWNIFNQARLFSHRFLTQAVTSLIETPSLPRALRFTSCRWCVCVLSECEREFSDSWWTLGIQT